MMTEKKSRLTRVAKRIERGLLPAAACCLLVLPVGCSRLDAEAQREIAARRVNITTWGLYCVAQACGLGYLFYQRNPPDENDMTPAKPPSLGPALKGPTQP